MRQKLRKTDVLHHFNLFFNDITFYKQLKQRDSIKEGEFGFDLIHPYCELIRIEMNKWIEMAYKYDYAEHYQKRLSRIIRNNNRLQSVLNELMVAYFLNNRLQMKFKEYNPPAVKDNFGEWVFTKNKEEIFIEVKTPWEERREGTFGYSQLKKLMKDIKKAYKQRPTTKMPFIVFITDELQLHLTSFNEELLDVLYGKRAICLSEPKNGRIEVLGYGIVDKRVIFQKNIHRMLSAIGVLRMVVEPNLRLEIANIDYSFNIYHNPHCHQECKLNFDWFKPYKQYLSHYKTVE